MFSDVYSLIYRSKNCKSS